MVTVINAIKSKQTTTPIARPVTFNEVLILFLTRLRHAVMKNF
jgi:hypothetical protein